MLWSLSAGGQCDCSSYTTLLYALFAAVATTLLLLLLLVVYAVRALNTQMNNLFLFSDLNPP